MNQRAAQAIAAAGAPVVATTHPTAKIGETTNDVLTHHRGVRLRVLRDTDQLNGERDRRECHEH